MTASAYSVAITNSSLGQQVGNPPYDGYIDPTSINQYCFNTLQTGSAFGTVSTGQVVYINNFPVTLVTGTSVANVATDINNLTYKHHAIAGTSGGNLTLINEPLHYNYSVAVSDGTAGITAQLGFATPTVSTVALPSTLSYAMAKTRGNWRWKFLMEQLSLTGSIREINSVVLTNVDLTFATNPTAISFNVVFDNDNYYAYGPTGTLLYGVAAVQQAVANALTAQNTVTDGVYNPTNTIPTPPPTIPSGPGSYSVTIGALTTSNATALAAVTVTNLTF